MNRHTHAQAYRTLKTIEEGVRPLAIADVLLHGSAIRTIDAALDDAKALLPDDTVVGTVRDLVTPEDAAEGRLEVWASDALILLAAVIGRLGPAPATVNSAAGRHI